MRGVLSSVVLALLVVSLANAQVTTGRLLGTVTDAQGGVIPGAKVEVAEQTTGQSFETLANERGNWSVPSVSTGTYKVTVSLAGFTSSVASNVKVDAAVPATRADFLPPSLREASLAPCRIGLVQALLRWMR